MTREDVENIQLSEWIHMVMMVFILFRGKDFNKTKVERNKSKTIRDYKKVIDQVIESIWVDDGSETNKIVN